MQHLARKIRSRLRRLVRHRMVGRYHPNIEEIRRDIGAGLNPEKSRLRCRRGSFWNHNDRVGELVTDSTFDLARHRARSLAHRQHQPSRRARSQIRNLLRTQAPAVHRAPDEPGRTDGSDGSAINLLEVVPLRSLYHWESFRIFKNSVFQDSFPFPLWEGVRG